MFIIRAECAALVLLATLSFIEGLRCYVCDSRSVIGYYDAEKDCNTDRSLQLCPDVKHKACMIEAFRHDAGSVYHIIKRCLVECPAFVNGTAEHTRCCAKEACNDVISIDVIDHRTASDLVADVREQSPQQPPSQASYSPPPLDPPPRVLTDESSHQDRAEDNMVEVERGDDDDFERRRPPAPPAEDMWTPLPPPPRSTPRLTADRPQHGFRPSTETTLTPPTLRRERRPLPGGTSGTPWWNGGLRSSSVSQRPTISVGVIMFIAVCVLHSSADG